MPIEALSINRKKLLLQVSSVVSSVFFLIMAGFAANNTDKTTYSGGNSLSRHLQWLNGSNLNDKEMHTAHRVIATIYYIGEDASEDNNHISNLTSAWDSDAVKRFGGNDSPVSKHNFKPKHNTYYYALPAAEFNEAGLIVGAREKSFWAGEVVDNGESLFKGRWIKLMRGRQVVYAQWHDVGPNVEDDYDYVFGGAEPKNTFGLKAGIDLSPDTAQALGFNYNDGGAEVTWQFVDENQVKNGPWNRFDPIDNKLYW